MQSPLYDDVHGLAIDIVNASARGDEDECAAAYAQLKVLCDRNDGGDFDHPLQWEALGDFSHDHIAAIAAYDKGLKCARRLGLLQYVASIKFAMAESYHDEGYSAEAFALANEAMADAEHTTDAELPAAIKGFLHELGNT